MGRLAQRPAPAAGGVQRGGGGHRGGLREEKGLRVGGPWEEAGAL